jgi:hypothetical protein
MRLLTVLTIAALSIADFGAGQALAAQSTSAWARTHHRHVARGGDRFAYGESHVGQVSGKLRESGNGKLPPEGAALGATPPPPPPGKKPANGAAIPVSAASSAPALRCSGSNSTTTECYTATQQMRPLAK